MAALYACFLEAIALALKIPGQYRSKAQRLFTQQPL